MLKDKDLRDPFIHEFVGPVGSGGGRGGRRTEGGDVPAAGIDVEDDVPGVLIVVEVVPGGGGPRIAMVPDARALVGVMDGVLVAPCVPLISVSISLYGNVSKRCRSVWILLGFDITRVLGSKFGVVVVKMLQCTGFSSSPN